MSSAWCYKSLPVLVPVQAASTGVGAAAAIAVDQQCQQQLQFIPVLAAYR
jgi:hypothetical protein